MPSSPPKPGNPLFWLGKYLSLALTLPASAFAGYVLGAWTDHWFHSYLCRPIGILAGVIAGLVQLLRELNREVNRP